MKMLAMLALLWCVNPPSIICPFDGQSAGWSGHSRERNGRTECNYRHIHLVYHGSLLVDEKHEFWVPCSVE